MFKINFWLFTYEASQISKFTDFKIIFSKSLLSSFCNILTLAEDLGIKDFLGLYLSSKSQSCIIAILCRIKFCISAIFGAMTNSWKTNSWKTNSWKTNSWKDKLLKDLPLSPLPSPPLFPLTQSSSSSKSGVFNVINSFNVSVIRTP